MDIHSAPRRGRPPGHAASTIESLLRRRQLEGLSWSRLSVASGIPISTLQSWARRRREHSDSLGFVEVAAREPTDTTARPTNQRIEIRTPCGIRIFIAASVATPTVLGEIVTALRASC